MSFPSVLVPATRPVTRAQDNFEVIESTPPRLPDPGSI